MSASSSKKSASKPAWFRKPEMKIAVRRAKGAPAKPVNADLKAAFARVFERVPAARCPEAFEAPCVSVDVQIMGDNAMAEMNATHLGHEGPTDVLSFPIVDFDRERESLHIGDILVSFETAKREAAERGIDAAEEITRYCVHGFLHCLGYDDSTPAKRRAMFAVQERIVTKQN